MAEKLGTDHMSVEMDVLWGRLKELELALSKKLDTSIKHTAGKLKRHLAPAPARRPGDQVISNELRNDLVKLTAYFKAEDNGFAEGCDAQNWLEAEQEVDRFLLEGDRSAISPELFTGNATPEIIAAARKAISETSISDN